MKDVFRFTPAGAAGPPAGARPARRRRRPRAADAVPRRRSRGRRCSSSSRRARSRASRRSTSTAGVYRRVVELGGEPGVIEVWDEPDTRRAAAAGPPARRRRPRPSRRQPAPPLRPRRRPGRRSTPPSPATGPCGRSCAPGAGIRVPGAIDPFEVSVRAVLGQQVSVSGRDDARGPARRALRNARARHRRARPDASLPRRGRPLAAADLTEIGLTRARARTVSGLAEAVAAGDLELRAGPATSTTPSPSSQALPGFGPWTAHYVAMRACGERDAFPASDLGLRRALGDDPAARAEAWRPWRAYGAMQLWLGPAGEPAVRTSWLGFGHARVDRAASGVQDSRPIRPRFPWSDLIFQLEIRARIGYG